MLKTDRAAELVEHYYSVAPVIAAQLTDPSELEHVWKVVRLCVEEIQAGNYDQATNEYAMLVRTLQKRYLCATNF